MTRIGKIARLPCEIRDQLNRRLKDGEPGKRLVAWLNSLPEVKNVIAQEFNGRAVSEQNLSEWKLGGYREWESTDQVQRLFEQSNRIRELAGPSELLTRLASVLTVELAKQTQELLTEATNPADRWKQLQQALDQLAQLRREEANAGRLQLDQERWRKKEADEKAKAESARDLFPLNAALLQYGFHQLVSGATPTGQAVMIQALERLAKKREGQNAQAAPLASEPNQANSKDAQVHNPTPSK